MKTGFFILLLTYFSQGISFGLSNDQHKIDSLNQLLYLSNEDTVLIDIRLKLGLLYTDIDRNASFFNIAEAIRLSKEISDKNRLAFGYEAMGEHYQRLSLYSQSLDNFMMADQLFENTKDRPGQARAQNNIGIIYGQRGAHLEALSAFNKVLEIRTDLNDSIGIGNIYNNLGNVYLDLTKLELARDYYQTALEIFKSADRETYIAKSLNNLGLGALEFDNVDEAAKNFRAAAQIYEELADISKMGKTFIHLGVCFSRMGDFDSATYYFDRSELILHDQNDHYSALHLKLSRAELFLFSGDFNSCIELANEAYLSAKEMILLSPQKQALYTLYKAKTRQGNFEGALLDYEGYIRLQDSIQRGGDQFEFERIQAKEQSEIDFKKTIESNFSYGKETASSFWNQSWFLFVIFFILLGSLILFLEYRRKAVLTKESANKQSIDYMRSTRILYVLAATMFVFIPFLIPTTSTRLEDSFTNRILISSAIIVVYIFSFLSNWIRREIEIITKIFYIILVSYTFYLLYINQLALELFLQLIIILMAITTVYKRLRNLLIFSSYIITVAIIFYIIIPNPQINSDLFIVVLISIIFVALVTGFSKLDLDAHLEFTNEVVRNADALVFIINRSGDNEYTSQSVQHILGYSPQELKNNDWIERIVRNKADATRIKNQLILIAIGALEPGTNPFQKLIRKDGKEVWLSINEKRLSANRVLVMGMVVTENKRIQDELEISESNFRQINETLADVFYLYNIETEKYEYLSPNSAEIIGPTPQFFYDNQNYLETYIVEEDQQRTRKAYQLILKGLPFEVEYRIRIGSELKWIREKSHPVLNEKGQVIKHAGLCQDITERKNTEQEIQKLSLIASNTENFILIVDKDNRVEWANQSFYKLTGLTEEETNGKLPLELISGPLTSEKTIDKITKAIFEDKRQVQCELTNYKADGALFFSSIEVTPLLNEEGNLEKYFVIGSDITQRIADQTQIEKLSLVASNTSNYIIIAHADNGIEWVNQAFIDKFGYSLEEVVGKFTSEILHDKNDQSGSSELINKTIFEERKKFSGEITHVTKEGKIIYSNVDITPLINDDGPIEKYFVVGVDISERKKYEEKIELANLDLSLKELLLNESEQNFRELIRSIKEVFYLFDSVTEKFIFISDSYSSVFGQTPQYRANDAMSWLQNVHPDDRTRVELAVKSRNKDKEFNEDFRLYLPTGELKWVNSRMFGIYNEKGEEIKISGFTEDITQKKQQELQIKKIADQLDIIHSIEKTILHAESTEAIIYNTLQKTIDKLPIIRASLTLFNADDQTYYAYARMHDQSDEGTDGKEFPLSEFSFYDTLKESKSNYLQNLKKKVDLSVTDRLIMAKGAEIMLFSPLLNGDNLIGSLNVCFSNEYEGNDDHYTRVTNEVANGLAIAIQQSQLKDKLHLSNRSINSSIEYAKMIQQAYIPSTLRVDNYFKDHFIINRPKDIVSGDFYWTGESGDTKIIVVGDCTGHGVPGAFMTIIGISELSNIVTQRGIVDPAKILKELDLAIIEALASSAQIQLKDGMDVAVFAYNTATNSICFEGARRPLYQMSANGLEIVEATKLSLGDQGQDFGLKFNTKSVSHAVGDQFYLFSDGITDQFGGERQRKFGRLRLEEFLLENDTKSVAEKGALLNERLLEWQGNSYQTDDMMFVAFTL